MNTIQKGSKIIDHTNDKEFIANDDNNPELIELNGNRILQYAQEQTIFRGGIEMDVFVLVESDDFEIINHA